MKENYQNIQKLSNIQWKYKKNPVEIKKIQKNVKTKDEILKMLKELTILQNKQKNLQNKKLVIISIKIT